MITKEQADEILKALKQIKTLLFGLEVEGKVGLCERVRRLEALKKWPQIISWIMNAVYTIGMIYIIFKFKGGV